jgi:recombinational DNA repair protein (RecF pathway)
MNDSLNVLILSQNDYKENDALVKTFSLEKGVVTFIAKGLLKSEFQQNRVHPMLFVIECNGF